MTITDKENANRLAIRNQLAARVWANRLNNPSKARAILAIAYSASFPGNVNTPNGYEKTLAQLG